MSSVWDLRRSTRDVKLAGLCGGIAERWGVDPVVVRVGFALLALSGGLGLVLYLAGWLLLPVEGRDTAPIEDTFGESVRRVPRELWLVIVVVACVAGFALFGWLTPFSIGPALVIALIWYFGFHRPRAGAGTAPPPPAVAPPPVAPFRYPGPATPFTQAAEAWQQRVAEYRAQQSATPPPAHPGAPWAPPPPANLGPAYAPAPAYASVPVPPRHDQPVHDPEQADRAAFLAAPDPVGLYVEPTGSTAAPALVPPGRRLSARRLRWATLLVLGLTMAGLGTADQLGAEIAPLVYAAAALLVVGLALVLATWFGRARGLLPVGVLLTAVVLGLSAASSGLPEVPGAPSSDRSVTYTEPATLPGSGDSLDVGTLTVDLSRLALTEDETYQAEVGAGRILLTVPPEVNVVVRYQVEAGSVLAFGGPAVSGSELSGTLSDPQPARPSQPTLTVDLSMDLGSVQVRR